jgi:hypothetical protein
MEMTTMSRRTYTPADRARYARAIRQRILNIEAERAGKAIVVEALEDVARQFVDEIHQANASLGGLRSAARRLEFVPSDTDFDGRSS